uniref:ABC transporter domain-containing protein n=1 Tax=Cyclophora tenuis TaxID=216820 RepID=A0A7S1DA40_CYCTE
MGMFLIYGGESAAVFVGDIESFFCTFLLTFGYGLSALPFSYLLSRVFKNHSSAQIAVMGIVFITGFVFVNAYFIMSSIESTQHLAEALRPVFRYFPAYNVGEGFIQLSSAYWEREILGSDKRPLDWNVTGLNLFAVYGLSLPYFLWVLLLEYAHDGGAGGMLGRGLRKVRGFVETMSLRWHGVRKSSDGSAVMLADGLDSSRGGDEDVTEERNYVVENRGDLIDQASVLLVNMWKVYPPSVGMFGSIISPIGRCISFICCCGCFRSRSSSSENTEEEEEDRSFLPKRAVRGVTTAVTRGETYGLLGVNGAGKTTTLGVLTGDIAPTAGEAYVAGHDVTGVTPGGVAAARKNIGFCPQVDPLLDLMTGRETLRMFGRLRGIPKHRLETTVNELLDRLTLTPHADKVAESYSGGNKRKLSLGIALIGDPRVLFIDEASSGMDPSARRHMWSLIEQVSEKRSVILTTHSMEEAEALCTRLGIMVKGQLLCLGSVQHLKTKYLDGYTIDVHCEAGTSSSTVDEVVQTILTDTLPGSELAERHGRFLKFDVSSMAALGLGESFRRLQHVKDTTEVENYSIAQCSLEQVFIKLVNSS